MGNLYLKMFFSIFEGFKINEYIELFKLDVIAPQRYYICNCIYTCNFIPLHTASECRS